jgi:hypothetical protein
MEGESSNLKNFLLGGLAGPEAQEIDLRIIGDPDFEEELAAAEHELVEAYLEGELSPTETELFRTSFLVGARRFDLLNEISLLKNYSKSKAGALIVAESKYLPGPGIFGKWVRLDLRYVTALSCLVAVLLISAGVYWITSKEGSSTLSNVEREYSERNNNNLSNLEEYDDVTSVSLMPGSFRGEGSPPILAAGKLSEKVLFRLALPTGIPSKSTYRANVSRSGHVQFSQPYVYVYSNGGAREIRFLAPKSVMQAGKYEIEMTDNEDGRSKLFFSFSVQ